jgi:hypothetical protein
MFSAVKANPAFVYTVGNAPLIYTNGHGHGEYFFLVKSYVSFIQNFVFGFWSLLATKLRKYKNIT